MARHSTCPSPRLRRPGRSTLGVGLAACSDDAEPLRLPARRPTTAPTTPRRRLTTTPTDEAPPRRRWRSSLPTTSTPPSWGRMRDAETFSFTHHDSRRGRSDAPTMSGAGRRFGDDGVEMKASSTGAQAMEIDPGRQGDVHEVARHRHRREVAQDRPERSQLALRHARQGHRPRGHVQGDGGAQEARARRRRRTSTASRPTTTASRSTRPHTLEAMEFPAAMAEFMPEEIVTEMWVDADNLPRKFSPDHRDRRLPGGGQPTSSTTEGTYSDFGIDVDIEAPPPPISDGSPAQPEHRDDDGRSPPWWPARARLLTR